jgi:hypothetical protein
MVPHPNRPNQPNSRRPGPFRSAGAHGNNYAFAMALTAITVAVLIIIVISLGRERHGIAFTHRGAAAELELSVQKIRHCERSEAIQDTPGCRPGLLRPSQ